ncbi:MAG TPA: hypothetical protein VJ911_02315, partial [Cryomorphaceae bacterium]|nr:hypothetical protein [Cryomorphaceae bacterium]
MALDHDKVLDEINSFSAETEEELESFRIKYLGKKGVLKALSAQIKDIAPEGRKEFGRSLNSLKQAVQDKIADTKVTLSEKPTGDGKQADQTKPNGTEDLGSRHPVSMVRREIEMIFQRIGFTIAEGPEIEDDWHNFSALNFPEEHPARDMQDTFFIEKDPDIALRTHTSSVQVRVMESQEPPIRIIAPGRVYRNEAISSRSHCIFHQVEGL